MKISKYSAMTFALMTGAMLVTSCATDVETGLNTDPEGKAITFAASVGQATRAQQIDVTNLGDFAVIGRGIHPDGVLYNSYMIGSADGGDIAEFQNTVDAGNSMWKLNRTVYWPATTQRALFIGYTTLMRGESSASGVLSSGTFGVNPANDQPYINGFAPAKADLSTTGNYNTGVWADGFEQKDLLIAFTQQQRGTSTVVDLHFNHALTQVSIKAGRMNMDEDNDERIVRIKGAWLVNAQKTGKLSSEISVNKTTNIATNKIKWGESDTESGTDTELETYGAYYNDFIPLKKNGDDNLLRSTLMLVPQSLKAWNGSSETTTGAYIMLLCRVELQHNGETHKGANITDVAIDAKNKKHYHQLFPVNTTKYDGSEYGFVCVPISTDWGNAEAYKETVSNIDTEGTKCKGMGKHYTFNLDICGAKTGAGVYPPIPTEEDEAQALINKLIPTGATVSAWVLEGGQYISKTVPLSVITARAADKEVGEPVLDDPIKFSVTVQDWATEDWKDGNGKDPEF